MQEASRGKTIIIAAGGTGGHLFPAQALARDLESQDPTYSLVFMGKGLTTNPFFHRELFAYKEVSAASPSSKKRLKSYFALIRGIWQAYFLLKKLCPVLVVGFGSFHAFPVLVAAFLRRVPLVLFESNSVPGKVNRLFSSKAVCSGVQFPSAAKYMKGKCVEVQMPFWRSFSSDITRIEAAAYFSLEPDVFTFLIFGGSQGAAKLNSSLIEALASLKSLGYSFQVIHLVGGSASLEKIQELYAASNIPSCIKSFEDRMDLAWTLAGGAVCRSGAATLAELMLFSVPSLLIPYPHASENHQLKNALFLQNEVGGALLLEEKDLSFNELKNKLESLLSLKTNIGMRDHINRFKKNTQNISLLDLIRKSLDCL